MNWFRHAFALDPPPPLAPSEEERAIVDRLARIVAERQMTVPAIAFLEMSRPLNRIAAQTLVFFEPVASVALTGDDYKRFARFLERSGSIDYLCRRIEDLAAGAAALPTTADCPPSTTEAVPAAAPRE